jgi:hypothetical protein
MRQLFPLRINVEIIDYNVTPLGFVFSIVTVYYNNVTPLGFNRIICVNITSTI